MKLLAGILVTFGFVLVFGGVGNIEMSTDGIGMLIGFSISMMGIVTMVAGYLLGSRS